MYYLLWRTKTATNGDSEVTGDGSDQRDKFQVCVIARRVVPLNGA